LIPAGSGFEEYRDTFVISEKSEVAAVGTAPSQMAVPADAAAAATGESRS
jgi:DNA-directed RNA polymerase subunit beta'